MFDPDYKIHQSEANFAAAPSFAPDFATYCNVLATGQISITPLPQGVFCMSQECDEIPFTWEEHLVTSSHETHVCLEPDSLNAAKAHGQVPGPGWCPCENQTGAHSPESFTPPCSRIVRLHPSRSQLQAAKREKRKSKYHPLESITTLQVQSESLRVTQHERTRAQ